MSLLFLNIHCSEVMVYKNVKTLSIRNAETSKIFKGFTVWEF